MSRRLEGSVSRHPPERTEDEASAPGDAERCELCRRAVSELTLHHLVPRSEDGAEGPTALLCRGCHNQVHALFTNAELATLYDSLDALREEPRMARYLRWASKQKPGRKIRVRKPRRR